MKKKRRQIKKQRGLWIVIISLAVIVLALTIFYLYSNKMKNGGEVGQTSASNANSMCGAKQSNPNVRKIMIIWEENESQSSIIGSNDVPYMNELAKSCGYAANYWAYTHPSLPNYMSMTSGADYATSPWSGDCLPTTLGCNTANASVFSQVGNNWKSYSESMPANCFKENSADYAARHNPAVYYTNISSQCSSQDVPLGTTESGNLLSDIQNNVLKNLTTITPNLVNDWHDGSASQADDWLKSWIPLITGSRDYQSGKLAILIVFDEGEGSGNNSSNTAAIWLSQSTIPGTVSNSFFDDYSVTKTIENILNKPELSNAQHSSSMTKDFNLR